MNFKKHYDEQCTELNKKCKFCNVKFPVDLLRQHYPHCPKKGAEEFKIDDLPEIPSFNRKNSKGYGYGKKSQC